MLRLLSCLVMLASTGASLSSQPQQRARLNVLFLIADDLNNDLGTYGGESNHFSKAGPGVYGFNWWFNATGGKHPNVLAWPDAPQDTVMSLGLHGNCSAMIPSLNIVVVAADANWGDNTPGQADSPLNQHLKLIATAGTTLTPSGR